MATLDDVDAARIVLDLIRDREVATAAPYALVDKISGAVALKYVEAMWESYPSDVPVDGNGAPVTWAASTNAQKGTFVMDHLFNHIRDVYVGWKGRDAEVPAGVTARDSARTEAQTDLRP